MHILPSVFLSKNMGRPETGHIALRAALRINPWLSERHLLPPGEDI